MQREQWHGPKSWVWVTAGEWILFWGCFWGGFWLVNWGFLIFESSSSCSKAAHLQP